MTEPIETSAPKAKKATATRKAKTNAALENTAPLMPKASAMPIAPAPAAKPRARKTTVTAVAPELPLGLPVAPARAKTKATSKAVAEPVVEVPQTLPKAPATASKGAKTAKPAASMRAPAPVLNTPAPEPAPKVRAARPKKVVEAEVAAPELPAVESPAKKTGRTTKAAAKTSKSGTSDEVAQIIETFAAELIKVKGKAKGKIKAKEPAVATPAPAKPALVAASVPVVAAAPAPVVPAPVAPPQSIPAAVSPAPVAAVTVLPESTQSAPIAPPPSIPPARAPMPQASYISGLPAGLEGPSDTQSRPPQSQPQSDYNQPAQSWPPQRDPRDQREGRPSRDGRDTRDSRDGRENRDQGQRNRGPRGQGQQPQGQQPNAGAQGNQGRQGGRDSRNPRQPQGNQRNARNAGNPRSHHAPAPPVPGQWGPAEEWRPTRRDYNGPAANDVLPPGLQAPEPAPMPPAPVAAPVAAPTPAAQPTADVTTPQAASGQTSPTPQPTAAPARKYPVYVPLTVAKQLEAEGKEAPLAVTEKDAHPDIEKLLSAQSPTAPAAAAPARPLPPQLPPNVASVALPPGLAPERVMIAPATPAASAAVAREPRHQQAHAPQTPPAASVFEGELVVAEGIVEISGKGFGFLRDLKRTFTPHPSDVFVTPEFVRNFNLRDGQWLKCETRRGSRGSQIHSLLEINGDKPESCKNLPAFEELTVINPNKRFVLETEPDRYTTRVIDLMTPIGKGQRGLIVSPPRVGKTTLLKHIASAVALNHPETKLMILLVDERPEEVTDIRRSIPEAEVWASSNDMDVKSHTRIAQLCCERARRLVEQGKDVFILLDSITRVGRAFNNAMTGGGRTGSGGLDSRALEAPRRLFASARNTEEGGSLTIVATALIETNSRMDDVIFQEFKGTGNMELMLDRKISDMRVYPAVDIFQSGTRREELLISEADLHKIHIIRRGLSGHKPIDAIERLLFFLKRFPTNAEMLREIPG